MRVFVEPPEGLSRAMSRVAKALKRYAPKSVEIVNNTEAADLIVLHVIGMTGLREMIAQHRKPYAILQYCLQTTEQPHTGAWVDIWEEAVVVWSYYDLPEAMRQDGVVCWIPHYHASLGVDSDAFYPEHRERNVTILTSGYVAKTESVNEVVDAVRWVSGGRVIHLGPEVSDAEHFVNVLDIDDDALRRLYNRCHFVSGLRKIEGFELPAAEGLLCGARPILYDKPCYRKWYHHLARFVPEGDYRETVEALVPLLLTDDPVSEEEIEEAKRRFAWRPIVEGFWQRVGVGVTA